MNFFVSPKKNQKAKMLSQFLVLTVLFLSCSAQASKFQGLWQGPGVMDSSKEGVLSVDPVVFEFSESDTGLFSKDCWNFKFNEVGWRYCSHRELILKNGQVFLSGAMIGTYSENEINVDYDAGSTHVSAQAKINDDDSLDYNYHSIDKQSGRFLKQRALGLIKFIFLDN